MTKTPVAFIIFNRPDTTKRVFDVIKKARPEKLFIIADGPRTLDEKPLCDEVRKVVEHIDWECEVHRNYSETNLGCRERVVSGLNWFFEHVEEGIVLEDDTLPDESFFQFCGELLEKYRDNDKVFSISGSDPFESNNISIPESYFFSKYCRIWGWATWRRSWKLYDENMKQWPEIKKSKKHYSFFWSSLEAKAWERKWDWVYSGEVDTWDFQWQFAESVSGSVCAVASPNIISNIGFDDRATHTTKKTAMADFQRSTMQFPLVHPTSVAANKKKDSGMTKKNKIEGRRYSAFGKLKAFIRKYI